MEERDELETKNRGIGTASESIGIVYEIDEGLRIPSDEDLAPRQKKSNLIKPVPVIVRLSVAKKTKHPSLLKKIKSSSCRFKSGLKCRYRSLANRLFASANLCLKAVDHAKLSIAPVLMVVLVVFTFIRAAEAKNNLEALAAGVQSHLNGAFNQIENGNLEKALNEANEAKDDIAKLKLLVQSWGQDLEYLRYVPNNRSSLVASERMLDSVYTVLGTMETLSNGLVQARNDQSLTLAAGPEGINSLDLIRLKGVLEKLLDRSRTNLLESRSNLMLAQDNLPKNLQPDNKKAIAVIDKTLVAIQNSSELILNLFGWLTDESDDGKNILVLFQNNTELRGSGGFIGSFAVARFEAGSLKGLDFETNIYKLDKEFMAQTRVSPPDDLSPLSGQAWAMRDSNWAVDGPEAFAKVAEFYKLETGKEADGVVALDTTLFTDLLKITGPIDVPEFGKAIGADNFLSDVQYEVEKGYFERAGNKEENEPKKILSTMMPRFINRISESFSDKEKLPQILGTLGRMLSQKHLLFYAKDQDLQGKIEANNLAGSVGHKITDYLFVHNSNVGGMKSSLNVKESLKQTVNIKSDGTVQSQLEISREHQGSGEWPDGINKNLVRVLVPQNSSMNKFSPLEGNFWPLYDSKLAGKDIFRLVEEAGKAEAVFWQNTEPGKKSKSTIDYRSNYSVDATGHEFNYRLYVQKQPGTLGDDFELEVNYPKGYKPANVKNYDYINRKIVIKQFLTSDKEFSIRFERSK